MISLHKRINLDVGELYREDTLRFLTSSVETNVVVSSTRYDDAYLLTEELNEAISGVLPDGHASLSATGYLTLSASVPFSLVFGNTDNERLEYCPLAALLGFDTSYLLPLNLSQTGTQPIRTAWFADAPVRWSAPVYHQTTQVGCSVFGYSEVLPVSVWVTEQLEFDFLSEEEMRNLEQLLSHNATEIHIRVFENTEQKIAGSLCRKSVGGPGMVIQRMQAGLPYWRARLQVRRVSE